MDAEMTDVIFRADRKDGRDVFALFPAIPGTREPHTCACYQHVGQHSSADLQGCIATSRPAQPTEYAALSRELAVRGYRLAVIQRSTQRHRREREAALAGV